VTAIARREDKLAEVKRAAEAAHKEGGTGKGKKGLSLAKLTYKRDLAQ
jgi:hypothetical protein